MVDTQVPTVACVMAMGSTGLIVRPSRLLRAVKARALQVHLYPRAAVCINFFRITWIFRAGVRRL